MKLRKELFLILILSFPSGLFAAQLPAGDFSLVPQQSNLRYTMVHKFHEFSGVSHEIEGRMVLKATDGDLMIRVPASSFNSGNANRDEHAKEVMEVYKFPYVIFKGKVTPKDEKTAHVAGNLTFHGVEQSLEVDVPYEQSKGVVKGNLRFPVKMTDYKIERPQLLFIKVEDQFWMNGVLEFTHSGHQ